jgi:hypothetical protein
MWDPRRLTTQWASTVCYKDKFTFTLWEGLNIMDFCVNINEKLGLKLFISPILLQLVERAHKLEFFLWIYSSLSSLSSILPMFRRLGSVPSVTEELASFLSVFQNYCLDCIALLGSLSSSNFSNCDLHYLPHFSTSFTTLPTSSRSRFISLCYDPLAYIHQPRLRNFICCASISSCLHVSDRNSHPNSRAGIAAISCEAFIESPLTWRLVYCVVT